ncbi:uncharacterized protein LOC141788613 [Halichoeres trimaculatus]|uniref:uncharacterized protein LOC141788613 n=1 Tax=Halichoeres trimaculatus TaxID=147232 RepID=UPI003D9E2658
MSCSISEMDSGGNRSVRRSSRLSSANVLSVEPTPRGPLKRTRKRTENQTSEAVINGSKNEENHPDDEESPNKKSRVEADEEVSGGDGGSDDIEMDFQESGEDLENENDQEIVNRQYPFSQIKIYKDLGAHGDMNLNPRVALGERCRASHAITADADSLKTRIGKPPAKGPVVPTQSAEWNSTQEQRRTERKVKGTSTNEHWKKMEPKAKSSAFNHHPPSGFLTSEMLHTTHRRVNTLPKQTVAVQDKKQEGIKKAPTIRRGPGKSSKGFMWYLSSVLLLVLFGFAIFVAYKHITVHQNDAGGGKFPFRAVKPDLFVDQLSLLENQFPSQRPDVWKMSKIHLEKHLKTAQPTEPVSLILTAGLQAERTLRCLAQGLASAFSSALNASVLQFDGASRASMNSDEVKLEIDSQLREAFEGDKPAAIVHRIEELPSGSTIIFYRYCDHENAAYKRVFLLFTVLLPQDEVEAGVGLTELEEMVHDYVKKRLVGSSSHTAFNEMDIDKFGGLWSRISHLILPVVSEKEVEQEECS